MHLFIWRHAEAEDGAPDLMRALTERGREQAAGVGHWIRRATGGDADIAVSPARRTRQTADALGLPYRIVEALAPGALPSQVLAALELEAPARRAERALVVVGHQPWAGAVIARLVAGQDASWSVRKAQVWWLVHREREGPGRYTVRAVMDASLV